MCIIFYIYVKDNTHLRYFCKKEDGNVFIFSRGYLLIGILCILNDISTKIFREKYSHDWAGNHGGGTPTWRCGKSMPKIQSKYVQPIMSKTSISTMSDVEVQTSQEWHMLSRSNSDGQSDWITNPQNHDLSFAICHQFTKSPSMSLSLPLLSL